MGRLAALLAALTFSVLSLSAQQEKAIRPLDLPMSFSGTYGELRHNHFHQGVDWRVGGRIGDPVHAIKSGFISRVSVSVTGYGNAVYIDHSDGTTSVYGHLSAFEPSLANRVKAEQYKAESFSVNLTFSSDEFPVSQGDVIGKVGNTGSSAGPHLHMEVRETESETPLNYISKGYYTPLDNLSPVFRRVAFYQFDTTYAVPSPSRLYMLRPPFRGDKVLALPEKSYLAIDAYDAQNDTPGKLAVEEYRVTLDGKSIFSFKVGDVDFVESPYIKAAIQAGESGGDLVRSWRMPGNLLNDRSTHLDDGLVLLDDYEIHNLGVELLDEHGNSISASFKVRRSDTIPQPSVDTTLSPVIFLWRNPNVLETDDFTWSLPLGALYCNTNVFSREVAERDTALGIWSDVWSIFSPMTALHSSGKITFHSAVPDSLLEYAFVASYESGGRLSYAGDYVGFGTFCLATDCDVPLITVDSNGQIRVSDDRSGVSEVDVYVDGKWHLSKYAGTKITILDRESISKGRHQVEVVASDRCSNETSRKFNLNF